MPTNPPSVPLCLCWAGSICCCPHSFGLWQWLTWNWGCQTSCKAPGLGAAEKCLAVTAQHSAVQHSYLPNAFHTQQIELLWSSHFFFFQQTKLPPPRFSLTKSFAICSKSIATFLMLCYRPHLGLHSKKRRKSSLSVSVSAPTKLKLKHSVH